MPSTRKRKRSPARTLSGVQRTTTATATLAVTSVGDEMEELPVPVEEQEESDRGEVNSDISIGHLDEFGDQGGGHEPEADDIDSIAERADNVVFNTSAFKPATPAARVVSSHQPTHSPLTLGTPNPLRSALTPAVSKPAVTFLSQRSIGKPLDLNSTLEEFESMRRTVLKDVGNGYKVDFGMVVERKLLQQLVINVELKGVPPSGDKRPVTKEEAEATSVTGPSTTDGYTRPTKYMVSMPSSED